MDSYKQLIEKVVSSSKEEASKLIVEFFYGKQNQLARECLDIVDWWKSTSNPHLMELMAKRKELAAVSTQLATLTANFTKNYIHAYNQRKIQEARLTATYAEDHSVSQATTMAIRDCGEIRTESSQMEAGAEYGRIILNQINQTLMAMNQEIADQRREQKLDYAS